MGPQIWPTNELFQSPPEHKDRSVDGLSFRQTTGRWVSKQERSYPVTRQHYQRRTAVRAPNRAGSRRRSASEGATRSTTIKRRTRSAATAVRKYSQQGRPARATG